jgi:general secretion pathway protein C
MESSDPNWSTAVAQEQGAGRGRLIRRGDQVAGLQVLHIGYNADELSPSVWFADDRHLCQSLVFSERPRFASAFRSAHPERKAKAKKRRPARAKKAPPRKATKRPPKPRGAPPLKPELARSIKKVSDNRFRVDRSALDAFLGNGAALLKGTRMVAVTDKAGAKNLRLSNVGKNSLLGTLGLKDGDQLQSINGFSVTDPEKALKAYARLRSTDDVRVVVQRGGKPMQIDIGIR